jgi:hypothetical protein
MKQKAEETLESFEEQKVFSRSKCKHEYGGELSKNNPLLVLGFSKHITATIGVASSVADFSL